MERIVLALGARGLVNAQFIVRDDGVYLIEVNPRASRTVPFMSKVTGVPMVELAVRISLGATLAGLGWSGGLLPPPAFVAVKAPAFSTAKLRGVDPSVGPGMQSTGEVIGIHMDPRVAPGQGAAGRGARAAATRRGRCPGARVHRRSRQGAVAEAGSGTGGGRLPAGGDAWHASRALGGRLRSASRRQAGRGTRRGARRGPDPGADRVRARSGWSSTRRRRVPAPSGMPPRSAWPRRRKGSSA